MSCPGWGTALCSASSRLPSGTPCAGRSRPSSGKDTYYFTYGELSGQAAYERAIDDQAFGLIYLTGRTPSGQALQQYLGAHPDSYDLVETVPYRLESGEAGAWTLYAPTGEPRP